MKAKDIFNLVELSKYLMISRSTLYKMTETDRIPHFKVGRQIRFSKETIDRWIRSQEEKSTRKRK